MSDSGRAQFGWPHPGQDRELPDDSWNLPGLEQTSDPLAEFCLGILQAEHVDLLSLKGNYRQTHQRQDTPEGEAWTCKDVNP